MKAADAAVGARLQTDLSGPQARDAAAARRRSRRATRPLERAARPRRPCASERLVALNEQLLAWPSTFKLHPTLQRTVPRRRGAINSGGIDWGHAEALAFASLLTEGVSVRLTGQDAERGTFSHRQAVLHDAETGETFTPLAHLPQAGGEFEIYNSPLSETAVIGFEYGFSIATPNELVLWEAQYGDFANVGAADLRPVHLGGTRQVAPRVGARAAAPARVRRAGPRALERAARAVPPAVRRGQHGRRVPVDARAVLPYSAAPGAASGPGGRSC